MSTEPPFCPAPGDALIIVDVQNDFLPGGALGVTRGDEVIEPLNRHARAFAGAGLPIFATRDWHPANHCSFKARGGPWPPHCVADTPGAAFAPGLKLPPAAQVVSKATTTEQDAYSGFGGTDLRERLAKAGVRRVVVGGLATDYCVLNTVLDARKAGLEVVVLESAVRAVDVQPGERRIPAESR
jgi:nicotinamidase/pyrazinamidase